MPFPRIQYCLVSDAVRPEEGGKASILGFLGIAPDVAVNVKSLAQPVTLAFSFLTASGGGDGKPHQVEFEILDGSNKAVFPRHPMPSPIIAPAQGRNTVVVDLTTVYPSAGRYTINLYIDGPLHFNTSFALAEK
jgi:hypothetical protein